MSEPETDCCICMEELGKTNITTTPCGHTFCFSCLMKSMDMKNTCPYCRTNLREEEDIIEESDDESYPDVEDDGPPRDGEYHWTLDWEDKRGLDNTRNPSYGLTTVDEVMEFISDRNMTPREIVSSILWRYDDPKEVREIERKSRALSKFLIDNDYEKRLEWGERNGMMEEDLRRHNRNPPATAYLHGSDV